MTIAEVERDVLSLLAAGLDNTAISKKLDLAEQTVRNYVSRLYDKTNLDSRVALAVWALEHGLGERST